MSLLQYFNFTSFTGLTKVETSGSVTESGGVLTETTAGAGSGWQQTGIRMTTGIKFYPGHVVYGQFQCPALIAARQSAMVLCLSKSAGISFTNAVAMWIDSPSLGVTGTTIGMAGYDDNVGAIGTPVNLTPGNWYDVKLAYINGGANDLKIGIYWRNSDTPGTLNPDSSAWTLMGTSTTTYTSGSTIYLSSQTRDYDTTSYSLSIDEWLWTDNGSVTSSIIFSSDFSSSTGWTDSSTTGGVMTIAGGIMTVGNTANSFAGIGRSTLAYALNLGHIITWDMHYTGGNTQIAWLSSDYTASSSEGDGYYNNGGLLQILLGTHGTNDTPITWTDTTDTINAKLLVNGDSTISAYGKLSTSGSYTLIGHYTGTGTSGVGQRLYASFFAGANIGAQLYIDNFVWDDGLDSPPAPSALVATTVSTSEIDLTYSDNGTSGNETGIKVESSLTGGGVGFSQIATVAQGVGAYNNTGLSAGSTYYYRVRSYITINSIDYNSAYSSEASATTTSIPVVGTSS